MSERLAILGDPDMIFPFRALGIQVFSPRDAEEAASFIRSLKKNDISLCFLHEKYFEPLKKEREKLAEKYFPVIVGYSDFRDLTDRLFERMREMSVKATGSDSLMNGNDTERFRGKNEES